MINIIIIIRVLYLFPRGNFIHASRIYDTVTGIPLNYSQGLLKRKKKSPKRSGKRCDNE